MIAIFLFLLILSLLILLMVLLLYSLVAVPNMLLLNEITVVSAWSLILIGLTFRQFVHLEQFPFVDLLLFFRELLPFDRGES